MKGIQLDYKLKPGMSSRFNQKMFGRLSYKRGEPGSTVYYIPGVLDVVPYYRIFEGRVFISTSKNTDFDPVMKFCDKFIISTVDKDDDSVFMKSGRDRWAFHAKERGFKIGWEEE